MEVRTKEASKRLGVAEHIVVSVPSSCYGMSYDELRAFAVKALYARGIVDGGMIFHGFRYKVGRHWYWSVHFHVLGFLRGGYECRGCKKGVCLVCHGFEARTRRVYEQDGCIVKVLGKRKTIFGTAWYQLNHSTIDVTKRRFHVVTWFGACSYRKLKVTVEKWKDLCPICAEECVKVHYFGLRHIVRGKGVAGYEAAFTDNLLGADSKPMWILEDGRSYH